MAARKNRSGWRSKWGVRIVVGAIIVAALVVAVSVAVPRKRQEGTVRPALPAVALGQETLYRVEIFLIVFYGGLLIAVPAYRGLVGGRLPIEVSARGAKFAEETAHSIEATQEVIAELERGLQTVEASAMRAHLNIDQIASESGVELRD